MVCGWPTMPKRGAAISATRRSRSSLLPVISACTGAAKPSAVASAGTSWTRPSVIMTTPAMRSDGTSASVEPSAVNSRVPSVSPSAWPASTMRTSRPGILLRPLDDCGARRFGLLRAVAEILARTFVDDDHGDRTERIAVFAGEATDWRAPARSAPAPASGSRAPRLRVTSNNKADTLAKAIAAQSRAVPISGANATPKFKTLSYCPSRSSSAGTCT